MNYTDSKQHILLCERNQSKKIHSYIPFIYSSKPYKTIINIVVIDICFAGKTLRGNKQVIVTKLRIEIVC